LRLPSSTRRLQRAVLADQLPLFELIDAEDRVHADQVAAIPVLARSPSAPKPAIIPPSAAPKPRTNLKQSGKRKQPSRATIPLDAKMLVSRDAAAAILSISVRAVDYLIATKRFSTRRIGTRVLIPIEDVRKFARSDHPERVAG
jgi:hypothetical protein